MLGDARVSATQNVSRTGLAHLLVVSWSISSARVSVCIPRPKAVERDGRAGWRVAGPVDMSCRLEQSETARMRQACWKSGLSNGL